MITARCNCFMDALLCAQTAHNSVSSAYASTTGGTALALGAFSVASPEADDCAAPTTREETMRKFAVTVATALVVALGLATNVVAADKAVRSRTAFTPDSAHLDSTDLVGMRVETPDGKRAGKISRLIVNEKDGKVSHAIIATGGIAGVAKHDVAVPWSEVKLTHNGSRRNHIVARVDRSTLDGAPRYAHARADRDRAPAASPATDRDRDGVPNRVDRAPNDPTRK